MHAVLQAVMWSATALLLSWLAGCSSRGADVLDCTLPGVAGIAKPAISNKGVAECFMVARQGTWHETERSTGNPDAPECALNGFDLVGTIMPYAFPEKGDRWFPVYKEEPTCNILLPAAVFDSARTSITFTTALPPRPKFALDRSFKEGNTHHVEVRLLYPYPFSSEQELLNFVEIAVNEARAAVGQYHGHNAQYSIRVVLYHMALNGKALVGEMCSFNGIPGAKTFAICDRSNISYIAKSKSQVLGLSPERRQEIFKATIEAERADLHAKHYRSLLSERRQSRRLASMRELLRSETIRMIFRGPTITPAVLARQRLPLNKWTMSFRKLGRCIGIRRFSQLIVA